MRKAAERVWRRGGGGGADAHSNVGREVAGEQDNTRRGGGIGPHAHGNAARRVVDDLNVQESGQRKP